MNITINDYQHRATNANLDVAKIRLHRPPMPYAIHEWYQIPVRIRLGYCILRFIVTGE